MTSMKYVSLGASGLKVSKLSLGLWHLPASSVKDEYGVYNVDVGLAKKIIYRAIDLGINFFDTANIYHGTQHIPDIHHVGLSERILGEAIKGYDRESLVIATKVRFRMADHPNGEGLSRKHIMWQIRESLRRLQLDYVDIYYFHRPDPDTPVEESLEAVSDLVRSGKVHYFGTSRFHPDDVRYIYRYCRDLHIPYIVLQEPYNWLERHYGEVYETENQVFPVAKELGLGIAAYIPLAQGVLTGKYLSGIPPSSRGAYVDEISRRYLTPKTIEVLKEFHNIASELGISDSQLALAWIFKVSEVSGVTVIPIVGATRIEHLEDNVVAVDINLDDYTFKRLSDLSRKALINWSGGYVRVKRMLQHN